MAEDQTVGRLRVELTADGRGLASGLAISGRQLDRFERDGGRAVSSLERRFGGLGKTVTATAARMGKSFDLAGVAISGALSGLATSAGLAGLASIGGAFAKATAAISEFDRISKQARTLGIDSSLLQSLNFAAVEASVSQEKLDQALNKFVLSAGLASAGSGELAEKLRRLDPALLQTLKSATANGERLRIFADALARTTSASARAALASAAFGESGAELARIFGGGSAALDDFSRRAEKLGLIVPQGLLDRSEQLANDLGVLTRVIDTNLSVSLINLGPVIVSVLNDFANLSAEIRRLNDSATDFARNPSIRGLAELLGFQIAPGGAADGALRFFERSEQGAADLTLALEAARAKLDQIRSIAGPTPGPLDELALERQLATIRDLEAALTRIRVNSGPAGTSPAADLKPPIVDDGQAFAAFLDQLRAANEEIIRRASLSKSALAVEDALADAVAKAAAAGLEVNDARRAELRTLIQTLQVARELAEVDARRARVRSTTTAYDVGGGETVNVTRPAPREGVDPETRTYYRTTVENGVAVTRQVQVSGSEVSSTVSRNVGTSNRHLSAIEAKTATAPAIGSAVATALGPYFDGAGSETAASSGRSRFAFSGGAVDVYVQEIPSSGTVATSGTRSNTMIGGAVAPTSSPDRNYSVTLMRMPEGGDSYTDESTTKNVTVNMWAPTPSQPQDLARANIRSDMARAIEHADR